MKHITDHRREFDDFVNANRNEDISRLRLRHANNSEPWIEPALVHIDALQRKGAKFVAEGVDYTPGIFPSRLSLEQATSARIARFHASLVEPGNRILDMTCGLGIDAAMMARRGCDVTAVDINPLHAEAARYNYGDLDTLKVIEGDSIEVLKADTTHYDVIFIDPARRDDAGGRTYNIHDCAPDIIDLMPLLRSRADRLLAKLSPMLDISQTIRDLPGIRHLYVIEDAGECKELFVDVDLRVESITDDAAIRQIDNEVPITIKGADAFTFTRAEEADATATYGTPSKGDYVYEPSACAMKAAPFNLLCDRFDLKSLSANTHVYFGRHDALQFPGRALKLIEVLPYASGVLKRLSRTYPKADVAVRNFGISAQALQEKIKVKPGGDIRILGVTDSNDTRMLLILDKTSL